MEKEDIISAVIRAMEKVNMEKEQLLLQFSQSLEQVLIQFIILLYYFNYFNYFNYFIFLFEL